MSEQPRHDETSTVGDLRRDVARFVDERDWRQFHDAKNLTASIAIEAAELMEHFQWVRSDEVDAPLRAPGVRDAVRDELADVLSYALSLANALDIDVTTAVREKLAKNARKYPAEDYRGRWRAE